MQPDNVYEIIRKKTDPATSYRAPCENKTVQRGLQPHLKLPVLDDAKAKEPEVRSGGETIETN